MRLDKLKRQYWSDKMNVYINKTIPQNIDNTPINGDKSHELQNILEKCALWKIPNVNTKIIRDKYKIDTIEFSIKNKIGVQLRTDDNSSNSYDIWYDYKCAATGFRFPYEIFDQENIENKLYDFLMNLNDFYSENMDNWKSIIQNEKKEEKIKSLAQKNIKVVVSQLMTKHNYAYVLEERDTTFILKIKMKKKQMLEISLPYKTFANRLEKIIPSIEIVKNILEQSELRVDINGYGNHMNWKNNKK